MPNEFIEDHISSLTGSDSDGSVSREDVGETAPVAEPVVETQPEEQPLPISDFDTVLGVAGEEEATPEEPAEQETVDKSVADGRLNDLVRMRQRLSEQTARMNQQTSAIEDMRTMLLQQAERDRQREIESLPTEAEVYGEEIITDPAISYLADKVESLQEQIQTKEEEELAQSQRAAQYRQFNEGVSQVTNVVQQAQQQFAAQKPDYYEAYAHARRNREAFYARLPEAQRKQAVDNEEYQFAVGCIQQGLNPAEEVYKLATHTGWNESMYQGDNGNQQAQAPQHNVGKIENGIQRSRANLSTAPGRGGAQDGTLTAKEFMNLPAARRLKILSDPDKFETLAKTGRIAVG